MLLRLYRSYWYPNGLHSEAWLCGSLKVLFCSVCRLALGCSSGRDAFRLWVLFLPPGVNEPDFDPSLSKFRY